MRPWHFSMFVTGLLCIGAGVMYVNTPPAPTSPSNIDKSLITRHVVTDKMETIASKMVKNPAPNFNLEDINGKEVSLSNLLAKGPVFLYFVMDGCPCSVDVEPIFHHLAKKFEGKVSFVAVIDNDLTNAKRWAKDNATPYALLSDPQLKVISAYKATNSAFSTLITREGSIAQMWPGYSKDMLKDMNERLAAASDTPVTPFDPLYAPAAKTAGCAFALRKKLN